MMQIKTDIEYTVELSGDHIVCDELRCLQALIGTTAVSGNMHLYNITKKGNKYIVPVSVIKQREELIAHQVLVLQRKLEIIRKVLKNIKKVK